MSKLSTKQKQKQSIVPQQIIQSRLLELSIEELEKDLENEIQINPVLEEKSIQESKTLKQFSDGFTDQGSYDLFLSNIPEKKDISDDLINQIDTSDLNENYKIIAREIIFNLDKNGFLDAELELIADNHNVDVEKINEVRKYVMHLNPKGVSSRDLKEYLIFQLKNKNNISKKIIENHFDKFLDQDIKGIKDSLAYNPEDIDDALLIIAEQNFSPIFDVELGYENVVPDAIIKFKDDGWLILINDRFLNKYQISKDYLDAAMSVKSSEQEKAFLKNHISSAQNILDALHYRSSVLRDVIEQILLIQGDYLSKKSEFLNSLKLEDIAKKIQKDISSVSRIIKNKYIDSPIGIVSLKSLFSSALTKNSGEVSSSNELKNIIINIIEQEDKNNPMSDSEIVKKLMKNDFLVARRTVAKYRKILNIKNSNQRKD